MAGQPTNHTNGEHEQDSTVIPFSSRLGAGRQDVWTIFNEVNFSPDCINLGQGHMNFRPPKWITDAAKVALSGVETNHYAHPKGRKRLREAIKQFYGPHFGRELDVETEILVTTGATEGLYAAFAAFLEQGDEVIMFEPYFDQYLFFSGFNGGKPVLVPLHPPSSSCQNPTSDDWKIDFDELRRAVTDRTKIILVNTPHNPLGKVFTRDELEKIAYIAKEFNLLVMADEVVCPCRDAASRCRDLTNILLYDSLVYPGKDHVRIANLPGMWNRTMTFLSAGKSFAATGWRVGWVVGPPSIIGPILRASTRIVFSTNCPLQDAVACGLEQVKDRKFFENQVAEYVERRELLTSAFDRLGLRYTLPDGGYFVLLDLSNFKFPEEYPFPKVVQERGRDYKATWFIAVEIGVISIPAGDFYCAEHSSIGQNYARFAFCKDTDTLKRACERLEGMKKYLQ